MTLNGLVSQLWAFALSNLHEGGDAIYPFYCSMRLIESVYEMYLVIMCYTSEGTGGGPGFFSGGTQLSHTEILGR